MLTDTLGKTDLLIGDQHAMVTPLPSSLAHFLPPFLSLPSSLPPSLPPFLHSFLHPFLLPPSLPPSFPLSLSLPPSFPISLLPFVLLLDFVLLLVLLLDFPNLSCFVPVHATLFFCFYPPLNLFLYHIMLLTGPLALLHTTPEQLTKEEKTFPYQGLVICCNVL